MWDIFIDSFFKVFFSTMILYLAEWQCAMVWSMVKMLKHTGADHSLVCEELQKECKLP